MLIENGSTPVLMFFNGRRDRPQHGRNGLSPTVYISKAGGRLRPRPTAQPK